LEDGAEVEVRSNGSAVNARVALRERMRPGAVFLIEGTAADNANLLNAAATVEIIPRISPGTPAGEAEEVAGIASEEMAGP
jgi:predicted molibdopterin-dependent oxidoreductase YjgC